MDILDKNSFPFNLSRYYSNLSLFEKMQKAKTNASKVSRFILIFNNSSPLLKNRGMNILKQVFGYEVDSFLKVFKFCSFMAKNNLGGNTFFL